MIFSDEYFMKQALREAETAYEKDEVPVGCVVVFGEKIIARGYNLTETLTDVTAHAEMQAITSAAAFLGGKYLRDCTLYVTLEPCVMCAGALAWAQISKIVIGARDPKNGLSGKNIPLHPKTEISFGILENESLSLIQKFFREKR